MNLERPPAKDFDRFDDWMYRLWTFINTPSSGINETNHAALDNLNSTNYSHLTANQATALTTGTNAAIHYHASDRDRANHSGTQLSTTISDFAVAVKAAARLQSYTVATLPAAVAGDVAMVTNALLPVFLAAPVGGGAVVTPVFYNGAAWIVG
jgi:hypothetical protein